MLYLSTMLFFYIIALGLLFSNRQFTEAAAFTTPTATAIPLQMSVVGPDPDSQSSSDTSLEVVVPPPLSSLPPIPRVTPPPSPQHLEQRQRCWNDQGFSVNCAVWTGYRYSWGPSSNPYDYWSGNGGSGGGGSVSSNASKVQTTRRHTVVVLLVMLIAIGLSGMISVL